MVHPDPFLVAAYIFQICSYPHVFLPIPMPLDADFFDIFLAIYWRVAQLSPLVPLPTLTILLLYRLLGEDLALYSTKAAANIHFHIRIV